MMRPFAISCVPIFPTRLLEIANPAPALTASVAGVLSGRRINELTPMTSPWMFSKGPPLFPILIQASVWIKS